jgi:formamidopyrimidine-DNA glycosylase
MSGHLCVAAASQPLAKHTHWRVSLCHTDLELRFRDVRRFGWIEWHGVAADRNGSSLQSLGVEALSLTAAELRRITARRRQIKALLMDQSAVAGLGNIYCDEALHRAGIHPLEIAADIDRERMARLCRAIKSVLREAIKANGSTITTYVGPTGEPGGYQNSHRVYGRDGEPCRKCHAIIVRIQAAGRSTHFCPVCQMMSLWVAK